MNNIDNSTELIEEWDWEKACPTGRAVHRGEAHKKGIAHEGVHLWIIKTAGQSAEILFQYRAKNKDVYPDCLDITVGGHVPFGKKENKIQKEAHEEIGISLTENCLTDLGYYRYDEIQDNFFHREFQRVYLYVDNRPLNEYIFNDGEVTGIYAVPLEKVKAILLSDIKMTIKGFDGKKSIEMNASRGSFHPLLFFPSMEEYMKVVLAAAGELVNNGIVKTKMAPLK